MSAELATVSFRTESGVAEGESWTLVDSAMLSHTVPWRMFRWYKGQRHYSGAYWSATMRDHVIYESRLELARLIFADFDRSVQRILAQPFLVSQCFEQSGSARSQFSKVTAAGHSLLLSAQQLHEYPRLTPRKLIKRITPSWQVDEPDAVRDIMGHKSCRPYSAKVAAQPAAPPRGHIAWCADPGLRPQLPAQRAFCARVILVAGC
jgi:hypothetical protein